MFKERPEGFCAKETAPSRTQLPSGVSIIPLRNSLFAVSRRVHTGDETYPGRWQFPGGRVEPGETPLRAAVREYAEETGQHVNENRLEYLGCTEPMRGYKGELYIGFRYGIEVSPGEELQHTEPHKQTPWRWITAKEMQSLEMLQGTQLYANRFLLKVKKRNLSTT